MNTALVFAGLVAGLAGSGHCLTMCGPIVGLLEAGTETGLPPLRRRVLYQTGRLLCYCLLGSIVVLISQSLLSLGGIEFAGIILRLFAAVLLVMLGVRLLLGIDGFRFFDAIGRKLWRRVSPAARLVLPVDRPLKALGAGFLWGLLPCGMVYTAAALAASTGTLRDAVLVMSAFWIGTLPALFSAGFGAKYLLQQRWRRLAGAAIITFACISFVTLMPSEVSSSHADDTVSNVHIAMPHH